jgi:hypothetical protein
MRIAARGRAIFTGRVSCSKPPAERPRVDATVGATGG